MEQDIMFGEHTMQEFAANLEELNKALGTGQDGAAYGDGAYNDMSALRPQSLEGTLKVVTAKEEHIKMWKKIGKKQAFNTVEEFNVLDSYGSNASPFFVEGGLPSEEDSNYIRQSTLVKFLGTTRVLTHPATIVRNTVGDIVAREQTNGTLWLLMKLERALYFADSSLNPLAFDGIEASIKNFVSGKPYATQHVIDLRGAVLTPDLLEDYATIIADNYGSGKLDLHLTNQVHKDFSKLFWANQRTTPGGVVSMGQPVRDYKANVADIDFLNNIFLKPEGLAPAAAAKGAPATPVIGDAAATADDASSLFVAGDNATYYYWITAVNAQGESATYATPGIPVVAGKIVNISITRVVSDPKALYYKVYRSITNDITTATYAFSIKDSGSTSKQVIVDTNANIPGTHKAFLLDMDTENSFCFKQLAPLMKLPLARISASERFMILLYGMVQMYNPRRNIVIKNIGTLGNVSNKELFGPVYGQTSYGTVKPVAR